MSDTVPLIAVAVLLLFAVGIFLRISWRLRRGGGSLTTVALGTTDAFLTKDRRKVAETIVDENAGKKFVRQSSDKPRDPTVPDSPR